MTDFAIGFLAIAVAVGGALAGGGLGTVQAVDQATLAVSGPADVVVIAGQVHP